MQINGLNHALARHLLILVMSCGYGSSLAIAGDVVAKAETPAIDRRQADQILQELRGIRQLLEKIEKQGVARAPARAAAPRTVTVSLEADRPTLGVDAAPVTVVEYTDYQCPYCRRFVQSTFPLLKRDYIDTGKVRWQMRDLPLGFHKDARKAAQAALCAGEQKKFWSMRDTLFRNNGSLGIEALKTYAAEIGLDQTAYAECLDSDRHLARIDSDASTANKLRITGTPTFVIGRAQDGKLTGKLVVGAQAPAVFAAEIKRLLEQKQKQKQTLPAN